MRLVILFILFPAVFAGTLQAQHEHHKMPAAKDTTPVRKDTAMHKHMNDYVPMSNSFSVNLPMNRNGSGTGWLPDASPMYGVMYHSRKWMYMLHGSLFLRYNHQDFTNKGSRGDDKADAPNWFMFMGQRRVGQKGLFHFSTMLSLDAPLAGGSGYPLLFQTGESYKGRPLIDRQHPHDLFSELSVSYAYALSKKADIFAYAGYPGEPALGPVAFMHRPSALDNPNAPVSHHWVDATHITFGVATLGVRLGKFKIEASSFTGREPDEERYGFDKPRFDSRSARVSFNPSANWALQVSHGFVKSPEALHADEDLYKSTASAIFSKKLRPGHLLNATAVWGMNKAKNHSSEHAAMIEAALRKNRNALYIRYDFTEKSSEELVLDAAQYGEHTLFNVHAVTAGYNYDIIKAGKINIALGGQLTFYEAPGTLDNLYGRNPLAYQVYLRVYPGLMN